MEPSITRGLQTNDEIQGELQRLREQVALILEKHWITALPREEWKRPVPWLIAGPGVAAEEPVRVLDAFFFQAL